MEIINLQKVNYVSMHLFTTDRKKKTEKLLLVFCCCSKIIDLWYSVHKTSDQQIKEFFFIPFIYRKIQVNKYWHICIIPLTRKIGTEHSKTASIKILY